MIPAITTNKVCKNLLFVLFFAKSPILKNTNGSKKLKKVLDIEKSCSKAIMVPYIMAIPNPKMKFLSNMFLPLLPLYNLFIVSPHFSNLFFLTLVILQTWREVKYQFLITECIFETISLIHICKTKKHRP